jgi:hypothetical protein
MKKLLLALLLASATLSSCQKNETEPAATPAPSLEGRWQGVSKREVVMSINSPTTDQTTAFPANSYSVEFTATELIVYDGPTVSTRSTYTRRGNLILNTGATASPNETNTILELTASRLVVEFRVSSASSTTTQTLTFSR